MRNVKCPCCDDMTRMLYPPHPNRSSNEPWCIRCTLEFEALQEQKHARAKVLQFKLPLGYKSQ